MEKDERTASGSTNTMLLSLSEIAAWQVVDRLVRPGAIMANLPALQRGFVWKTRQVEDLWDSVVRGFPIGAFLVAPYSDERGVQQLRLRDQRVTDPTHHLLDGQQRATGIALGFLNPWQEANKGHEIINGALWLDLGDSPVGRDAEYIFRVLTRSHPWGYRRNEERGTLGIGQIREAVYAFKETSPEYTECRPHNIPLSASWPRDAAAPIPVPLMILCLLESETPQQARLALSQRMRSHPFLRASDAEWHNSQKRNIEAALLGRGAYGDRLDNTLVRLYQMLKGEKPYKVATLEIHLTEVAAIPEQAPVQTESDEKDPIETLFVRINSGGTPLEGEELIYSLLKATWTDAPLFIDKLRYRMAAPSRICLLCARLVLARQQVDRAILQAAPSVGEFRRLMRGVVANKQAFQERLKDFVIGNGVAIFERAHALLVAQEGRGNLDYALPPALATELAQKVPDVFFVFLRWIDRMLQAEQDPLALDHGQKRRLIGFLTATAWFAKDARGAMDAVWQTLQTAEEASLRNFFNRNTFRAMLTLGRQGARRMRPLVPPQRLNDVLEARVTNGVANYPGIGRADSAIWQNGDGGWNRWNRLVWSMPQDLLDWYNGVVGQLWTPHGQNQEGGVRDIYREEWGSFLDALWGSRSVLLYAQRRWMLGWFADFDPSQPDTLEDKNRPWDYDHIHAQNYLRNEGGGGFRNIPNVIRNWHQSIGNLRAWPLEANRSDGTRSPHLKLDEGSPADRLYGLATRQERLEASFIDQAEFTFWSQAAPNAGGFPVQYLAQRESFQNRQALIKAIVGRFVRLYGEWYGNLKIGEIMPGDGG